MFIRTGFSLLVLLTTAASAMPTTRVSRTTSPRVAYDRQIRVLEHVFATHSQDEAQIRSLYTRDAVLVEADGNEIHGRDHIVPAFRKVLASSAVANFRVTTTTFRTDGKLSYAAGIEDIEERDTSGLRHGRNRFFLVMKHEADGNWRLDYVLEARS